MQGQRIYRIEKLESQQNRTELDAYSVPTSRRHFMRSLVLMSVLLTVAVIAAGIPQAMVAGAGSASGAISASISISDRAADVVVEVKNQAAFQRVYDLAAARGIAVPFASDQTGILTLGVAGLSDETLREIASIPGVTRLSSEHRVRALFTPDDSSVAFQWGLDTIHAYEAWDISRGTHDVVVAVLDTGIDWNHPDLAANMWVNPGEIPGDGIDNDGNGYVDDVCGYDFQDNDPDPMPLTADDHGTHCWGITDAVTNNDTGVASIGWGCRGLCLRAGYGGGIYMTPAIAALYYSVSTNCWVKARLKKLFEKRVNRRSGTRATAINVM
jgi:subtilisin family serine protease